MNEQAHDNAASGASRPLKDWLVYECCGRSCTLPHPRRLWPLCLIGAKAKRPKVLFAVPRKADPVAEEL